MPSRVAASEALSRAVALIQSLRDSLPGKMGRVLVCIDEIREAWREQDLDQFPFKVLGDVVGALEGTARAEYDTPEQEVDRRSRTFDQVVNLDHRLRLSLEFLFTSKVFEGVEQRFKRIDDVLPARNYAVRDLISELKSEYIASPISRRLESAVQHFDRQEYKAALQDCGEAGEALFGIFRRYLSEHGLSVDPKNVGPALEQIRASLGKDTADAGGYLFRHRSRIEWFLLFMFDTLHYLRNAASHALETEEGPPPWQSRRRGDCVVEPEYTRLGLCLSLQIAVELQALLEAAGRGG